MDEPYLTKTITTEIRLYNPKYGDERVCKCGHEYSRHFDSGDNMEAIGCKYCGCHTFQERTAEETQEIKRRLKSEHDSRYPKTLEDFKRRLPNAVNFCYSYDNYYKKWYAYLMGEGSEQMIARFEFPSKEAIIDFYKENGIHESFPI